MKQKNNKKYQWSVLYKNKINNESYEKNIN